MRAYSFNYKMSVEVPEGFRALTHREKERYNITPTNIFILLNEEVGECISIDPDELVSTREEFEELINLNLNNMESFGNQTVEKGFLDEKESIFRILCKTPSKMLVLYFFIVNGRFLSMCIPPEVFGDSDKLALKIIDSFKTLPNTFFDDYSEKHPELQLEPLAGLIGFKGVNTKNSIIDGYPFTYVIAGTPGITRLVTSFEIKENLFFYDEEIALLRNKLGDLPDGLEVDLNHIREGVFHINQKFKGISSYEELDEFMDKLYKEVLVSYKAIAKEVSLFLKKNFCWNSCFSDAVQFASSAETFGYTSKIDFDNCEFEAEKEGAKIKGELVDSPDGLKCISTKVIIPYTNKKPILETIEELSENPLLKTHNLIPGFSFDGLMITLDNPVYTPYHLCGLIELAFSIADVPTIKEAAK